jgi:hypothetical protein
MVTFFIRDKLDLEEKWQEAVAFMESTGNKVNFSIIREEKDPAEEGYYNVVKLVSVLAAQA